MKERIIKFFKTDRSYKGAALLYNEIGQKLSLKKQLNTQQESDYLKGVVFDELRIMAEIPLPMFTSLIGQPIKKETESAPAKTKSKEAEKTEPDPEKASSAKNESKKSPGKKPGKDSPKK